MWGDLADAKGMGGHVYLLFLRDLGKAIRPGEAKLDKATAAQKANQVVCSLETVA